MRCAILFSTLVLVGCSPEAPRPPAPARATRPEVVQTIELPNGDGRIYVVSAPDKVGLERSTCLVHVAPEHAPGAIACTQPQIHPVN